MLGLKKKKAVITGGLGHIGLEIVQTLCKQEVKVLILDNQDHTKISKFSKIYRLYKNQIDIYKIDLVKSSEIKKLLKYINLKYQNIDILINAIGMVGTNSISGWNTDFKNQSKEAWNQALDVNLTSVFFLIQSMTAVLKKSKNASIINISSIYADHAPDYDIYSGTNINNPAAYSVSKAGINYLTKWLAVNLAPKIRVNTISPGGIYRNHDKKFVNQYTNRTLLKRMGKESDISGAILYFASDMSEYVTGQNLIIDGGWTIK